MSVNNIIIIDRKDSTLKKNFVKHAFANTCGTCG